MNLLQLITDAEQRIRPYIRETPLEFAPLISTSTGVQVYLKLENTQYTGSFKVRGALNALLSLNETERQHGVIAASSGNHGMAIAFGMRTLGVQGTVYVPATAAATKIAAIRAMGAAVREIPGDPVQAEIEARAAAEAQGMAYISPYNDVRVVAGQGTLGLEIVRQVEQALDAVLIAVGGGGLAAGVASYVKSIWPTAQIIGCQPAQSAVMAASVQAGQIIALPDLPTLSDGTAGGIETDAITFVLCRNLIDQFVLVSEEEIAAAICMAIDTQHTLIEGAAGVALAGLLRCAEQLQGKRVAVILCGANVSVANLRKVLGS
jgi:threonine dehydratase